MEAELAKSIALDDHLEKAPAEAKYGHADIEHNYVANGQIMVTITLDEYRMLLTQHATDKVNEANSKRFTVERERDDLKKQVTELQRQLNELRAMIASAMPVKASADAHTDE